MIKILQISDSLNWDSIVSTFPNYDVYYLSAYAKSFQVHRDGEPILIYYETVSLSVISVMMKRDISKEPIFQSCLSPGKYFDMFTPYGYGGFLFKGDISIDNLLKFNDSYCTFIKENNIISSFTRFHPQLGNAEITSLLTPIINLGYTTEMNLDSEELIWANLTSKNRNMIRKAKKSGIIIEHAKSELLLDEFIRMYNLTMIANHADEYYFFDKSFYLSIHNDLKDNYEMFYAKIGDKIIAMSIVLFLNNRMHYHLSCSIKEYKNMAPGNLLLYKAACWGCLQGFKTFHLGGGVGSGEDGLFKFKKSFNRFSKNQFSIGNQIFNHEMYSYLVNLRKKYDNTFNVVSSFFPLYREKK